MSVNSFSGQPAIPASYGFTAGKNKIINGDFGIWQRGTSFSPVSSGNYVADRFGVFWDGTGATRSVTQQAFTPGSAPVAGYEAPYFMRFATTVAGSGGSYVLIAQPIEDARTFAGQTITVSFWMKAASSFTLGQVDVLQVFNGSSAVTTVGTTGDANVTTSWKRFVYTINVPSVAGKTFGANNALQVRVWLPTNATFTIDTWGWQAEAGATATSFQTATGTIQGELAACQRYYWRNTNTSGTNSGITGVFTYNGASTAAYGVVNNPVPMRTIPTSVDFSNLRVLDPGVATYNISAISILGDTSPTTMALGLTTSGGIATGKVYYVSNQNATTGYFGVSAEL